MISDWSHPTWELIHTAAFHLAKKPGDVHQYLRLLRRFFKVLPCPVCSHHASLLVEKQATPITSHKALCIALWQFHNAVNTRLNKQEFTWVRYVSKYSTSNVTAVISRFAKVFGNLSAMLANRPGLRDLPQASNSLVVWCKQRSGWTNHNSRRGGTRVMSFT